MRDHPYLNCNFLVDLGKGTTDGVDAGFQELSPIALDVDVVEYRNGNEKENHARLLTGLSRPGTVTLRRGIIGSSTLYDWIDAVRNGEPSTSRTVQSPHRLGTLSWAGLSASIKSAVRRRSSAIAARTSTARTVAARDRGRDAGETESAWADLVALTRANIAARVGA